MALRRVCVNRELACGEGRRGRMFLFLENMWRIISSFLLKNHGQCRKSLDITAAIDQNAFSAHAVQHL